MKGVRERVGLVREDEVLLLKVLAKSRCWRERECFVR